MEQKPTRRDCFIPGCTSQMGQVLFMSAYKSDGLQRWWSETVWAQRRKNKHIPKNTRVCERHFEEKFIDRSYKMPRLFPEAWPTMYIVEPTQEELETKSRIRSEGRAKVGGVGRERPEVNPRFFCRLCGRREKRPLEDQLYDLKDGEELLKFCLGQFYVRTDLPQGICYNCMDTAESFLEFIRKCEETQHKLDGIFMSVESLKVEPDCELLGTVELKQEKEEPSEEMTTEYLEEVPDNSLTRVSLKTEEFVIEDVNPDKDDGYELPDDDLRDDSDSVHSDGEFKPVVDRRGEKTSHESFSEDSFTSSDSEEDKPLRAQKLSQKKRGPKPKNQVLSDGGGHVQDGSAPTTVKKSRKSSGATSQETSRICPICGKILVHKGNFTSHLKIHSEKKDYVCNICGKQYYIRRELQMHIESLHEKKTFVCNICGIKCAWRKGLQRHMKNKHSDESSLKHKCTYCGKAFLLPNQLRLHVMKHTGDRITCEICGAGYRFNYMLTQHKIREHGMEFKGVKLYKNSSRSRKNAESKRAAAASTTSQPPESSPVEVEISPTETAAPPIPHTEPPIGTHPHVLEPSHDSMMSESSQPHQIQPPPSQHHSQLQQYHHAAAVQLERGHYPPGFVYPGGPTTVMMLPPGSYSG